mgnify:CR=1 FL=1|jgi:hypothetical protein|tara:strand:+ start:2734 stop:3033 length:300 start_codon:yes stop_codon:yes gene_type:complete
MKYSADAVYLYIPLMKNLGMRWSDIKCTPRRELEGLLLAWGTHEQLHAFDGYSSDEISTMSKDRPQVRQSYNKTMEIKAIMESKIDKERKPLTFQGLIN